MSDRQSWLCVGGPLAGQFHNPGRKNTFVQAIVGHRKMERPEDIDINATTTVQHAEYRRQRFMCDGVEISFWVPEYQTAAQTLELLLASYELAEANARSKAR